MPPRPVDPFDLTTEEGRRRVKSRLKSIQKLIDKGSALSTLQQQDREFYTKWKPLYEEYVKQSATTAATSAAASASAASELAEEETQEASEASTTGDQSNPSPEAEVAAAAAASAAAAAAA